MRDQMHRETMSTFNKISIKQQIYNANNEDGYSRTYVDGWQGYNIHLQ